MYLDGDRLPGPLFMKSLKNYEFITEETFSFFSVPYPATSYIDFGVPQASGMRPVTNET